MGWTWRCERRSGESVDPGTLPGEGFASQSDAESWLGESWPGLLADGVDQVYLLHGGQEVYGPMSLHAAE